ncbi:MAG: hypothetical protein H0X07_08730, partial [Gemmatimonadales bacterium]|nr:hypothetical protein [Gemmatimonadales bacterium]
LMKAIRLKLGELGFDSLIPIDRTRLTLEEGRVPGKPPRLVLALQTVREFSCLGYYIDHDMRLAQATAWAAPDTVLLNIHGVAGRGEMCPLMIR